MRFRHMAVAALLLGCVALLACRPTLQIRIVTHVFHDGSMERSLTVAGRTGDGEIPDDDDWFDSKAGLRLAEPEGWARVERLPGRIRADGFFAPGDTLPALLALGHEGVPKTARSSTALKVEERALLRRWDYLERHGDPFSAIDRATALRELIDRAVEIVDAELRREFGADVDVGPAGRFMREELHALIASLLVANRDAPGGARRGERLELWREVLRSSGIPTVTIDDGFWDSQIPLLVGWGRDEIAGRLASAGAISAGETLAFLPGPENWEERGMQLLEQHIGDEERLEQELGPEIKALSGYFGDGGIPHFLFESAVTLPGRLLLSNGSCSGGSCRWIFREEDLSAGEMVLRVSSVEPIEAALVRLGARRALDDSELLQLVDLLWKRDPQGALLDALTDAVERGKLEWLLTEDVVPEELAHLARELYLLLEP